MMPYYNDGDDYNDEVWWWFGCYKKYIVNFLLEIGNLLSV